MTASTQSKANWSVAASAEVALWRRIAVVSGCFCLLAAALLLANHARVPSEDPLNSADLIQAREELKDNPSDAPLKERIRELDLEVRRRFFRHVQVNATGGWLLLAGAGVFLVAAGRVATLRRTPPMPEPRAEPSPDVRGQRRGARWSVAGTGALVALIMVLLAVSVRLVVPEDASALAALMSPVEDAASRGPTWEEISRQWPRFRGPRGDGVVLHREVPEAWNGETGEGILWKAELPLSGFGSPIAWGDRVFVAGGTREVLAVLCYDGRTGDLLWQGNAPAPTSPAKQALEVPEHTGYAAATPATDGARVFAVYATGDLAAFDFQGHPVWHKDLGVPENMYGHSTSLLVWDAKLIVQFDHGEAEAGKSRLYALDPVTGRVIWEQRRAVPSCWATPIVLDQVDPPQIITLGEPWVLAYDLDGRELWRAECLGTDLAPSPVYAGGLVIATSPNNELIALRPDGAGDVTKTHIAWTADQDVPDIASPVATANQVFALATFGILSCLNAQTGEPAGDKLFDFEFNASPSLVGDRLLLVATTGECFWLAANETLEELGQSALGEEVHASPAFVPGRIYFRGNQHLIAVGAGEK